MENHKKKVLIAHQSTIPHYRIPFYEALQEQKSDWWDFDVVYSLDRMAERYNAERKLPQVSFPVLSVKTTHFGGHYCYQHFFKRAGKYDLIVVEHALNNLTYPLCQLHKLHGVKLVCWGHGWDRSAVNPGFLKRRMEGFKHWLGRRADGYLAYTGGVKEYLVGQGYDSERVFVLNNTVDLVSQRRLYLNVKPQRKELRRQMELNDRTVFIFVGRPTAQKRIDLLLEAFKTVAQKKPASLLLVGCGGLKISEDLRSMDVRVLPRVTDMGKLAKFYAVSDAYVLPGKVGLGPIQAMSCDLPLITIESPDDSPEVEYLTSQNSIVLKDESDFRDYAETLYGVCEDVGRLNGMKEACWATIEHLTIDAMADNFDFAISRLLKA